MTTRTYTSLVDDLDGTEAVATARFAVRGVTYEIDLSDANTAKLERLLAPYRERGRRTGGRAGRPAKAAQAARPRKAARATARSGRRVTAFAKLSDEDKLAFRSWVRMPHARRMSDEKVKAWLDQGKPAARSGGGTAVKKAATKKRAAGKAAVRKRPARKAVKKAAR